MALCNIYNENRNEIILCPQLGNINLSIGNIPKDRVFLIRFLSNEYREAFEFQQSSFQNPILDINPITLTDNNTSFIHLTPKVIGTTILIIGDINLTLTVVENIYF